MARDDRTRDPLDAVITAHADELLSVPEVMGVGVGLIEGRPVIEVLTNTDPEAVQDRLPFELDGYPLHVKKTGRIRGLEAGPGSS